MDFQYRGNTYQTKPLSLTLQEKQLIGKYRGQDCYRAIYDISHVQQAHPILTYRGISYGSKAVSTVTTPLVEESTFKIAVPEHQKPVRSSRHHVMTELDRIHNQFLLEKLEQRMSSAREKGDRNLVQMLELEKTQLQ